jgi:hypothetical protein
MQEKNSKPENQQEETPNKKEGIELLKEIGLKEVSNKTFINLENLTALIEKDFKKLNRTKALGFIQILQREFQVDLQDLKEESIEFYNRRRKPKEAPTKVAMIDRDDEEKPKKILTYILLAIAAGVGAYLLFAGDSDPKQVDTMDLNVVKNEVITQEAKESLLALDERYEKEINDSEDVDLNRVVEEMFKYSDSNESRLALAIEGNETNQSSSVDTNTTFLPAKEEKIEIEKNSTLIKESNKEKVEVQKVDKPLVVNKPKEVQKPLKKEVKNSNKSGLYITPIQKAWVGVIFLDSMKKKDFLIRKTLKLDASKDQIILVGHKNFKIFNKRLEQGFKSKKMVRFLYKDGELREISKKEYMNLRGGVRW